MMKNFILITTLAMLTGTITLKPLNIQAQSTPAQNAPTQDPKRKMAEQKFINALEAFYSSAPEANNLDALFSAGEEYLEIDKDPQSPAHLFIVAQQSLAWKQAVAAGVYKNLDKVKTYAERSLQAFETLNPPDKFKKAYDQYNLYNLRDETLANLNYFLGYYLIETKGDQPEAQDQALAYVNKSIQVRGKDNKALLGWKDPNNYSLRSYIYTKRYLELRKQHDSLTEEQKTSDTSKDLVKQINQLLDAKMIPELARIIATATDPAFESMKNEARDHFNMYWKYRVDDPSKAPAFLKSFEADPTIEGPPVPAKGFGAQASDISGTWVFSITWENGAPDSQRTFALKQQGEKVTGLFLSPFEEKEVTGSVTGNTVMIVVEIFRDNRTVKVTYRGTIESPVKMAGAVEHVGDYLLRGKWTAVKRDPSAKGKAGEVIIEPATLTTPETGTVYFQLGTLYVPENRADPNSRIIGVGFARFRASQPTGAPPTFHLPGGPGESYLTGLNQSNRYLRSRMQHIAKYQRVGDVVFVDQRGFSERGDRLMFKYRMPEEPLDKEASLARFTAAFTDLARAAVAEFAGKGIDLRGYTVKELADDVNDLRRALGYDRITLVGSSFGSQWSFAVMRRHPDIVMRALLSGVEPLDYGYDMPSHVFAAIQRMWWEAEKDPRIKPYLPEGGLAAAAREVLRRLERAPVKVTVKARGSKPGETSTITLGPEDFRRIFPRGTNGPAFLISLYHEQYDQWAYSTLAGRRGWEYEFPLIHPLIDTSLGVTPRREYLLRTDAGTEFLGQWNFDRMLATADIWPTQDVGDEFRTEVVSRIPVVFAQGDWDMQTPVENALNIAPYFPNGRLMIATNGGHGVIEPIAYYLPDLFETLLEFLRTGSTANLPARVTLPAPKFTEPHFPPPPPPAKARP